MNRYNPTDIEQKWQDKWEQDGTYKVDLADHSKPKYYGFSMLPGITGAGIHIGHGRTYQFSDIKVRAKRQQGYNAYNPVGWDSFGLPVENYAIKVGKTPRAAHDDAKVHFKKQLKRLGYSYDWSKEISTADPQYYKWTQWIFNKLYENGLAYQKESPQWWCETDQTVLANEQVEGGTCWRCHNPVVKKNLKQWFFKITEYADEILEATDDLNWTESVKTMQKNWIGKSQGAEIEFVVGENRDVKDTLKFTPELTQLILDGKKWSTIRLEAKDLQVGDYAKLQTRSSTTEVRSFAIAKITNFRQMTLADIPNDLAGHESYETEAEKLADYQRYYGQEVTLQTEFTIYDFELVGRIIPVFSTRPDTLFGATFMVLAPEHSLAKSLANDETRETVEAYIAEAARKSEIERMNETREKTGVFTGSYAVNPVNGERIPIWLADYVLAGYGTGAIMAVPAHDERDFAFAEKFKLPIRQVISERLIHTESAHRPDVPVEPRNVVCMVVKHPLEDKYLVSKPTGGDYWSPVMGGIDAGETAEQAARRELLEESGYHDIASVQSLDEIVTAEFYAQHKKVNRIAAITTVKIELATLDMQPVSAEEQAVQELRWVTMEEMQQLAMGVGGHEVYALAAGKPRDMVHEGRLVNSGAFDGMESSQAREEIVAWLEQQGVGHGKTTYKMRDWLISRQRYWGAPIPIVHVEGHGAVAVPDSQLPVILPEVEDFKPKGGATSVLATVEDWVHVWYNMQTGETVPFSQPKPQGDQWHEGRRETDTLDGYACSSWYFLRYLDPFNDQQAWNPQTAMHWAPVDFYNGGDHAVAHLLYARFWMRFFYKQGFVPTPEPFKRMMYNAYIMAPDGRKMSKSLGNVIDPLEIMDSGYGADALRVYEMFIAPFDADAPWDPRGVPGTYRFLNRVWNLTQEYIAASESTLDDKASAEILKIAHGTVKKVTADLEDDKFNTPVSAMMEAVNTYFKLKETHGMGKNDAWTFAIESLLQVLAPFAPHITEELWHQLGHDTTIHVDTWPKWDDKYLTTDHMTIIVQVNGKLRAKLTVAADVSEEDIKQMALTEENVAKHLEDKQPTKVIYVPGRLVSIVV